MGLLSLLHSEAPAMTAFSFSNRDVARALRDVADMMRLKGENRFRVTAMDKAAATVQDLDIGLGDLVTAGQLESIDGIGKGIAREITSLFAHGEMEAFTALRQDFPPGLLEILRLPNIGPKKALALWRELGVSSLSDLEQAAQAQRVQGIKGFTVKSEAALLASIQHELQRSPAGEPIGLVLPAVEGLIAMLQSAGTALVVQAVRTGELRRWQETIDQAEILVASSNGAGLLQFLQELPTLAKAAWIEEGQLIRADLHMGLQVHITVCCLADWAWQLVQTTGDAEFRQALEKHSRRAGLAMGPQGWVGMTHGTSLPLAIPTTEEEVFTQVGLSCIAPEQRTCWATPDLQKPRDSARLVTADSLRGELHAHSTFSDGRNTLAEMAQAAIKRGYQYWGVTDHGVGHGFGDSLDAAALQAQAAEIDDLNQTFMEQGIDFRLLKGVEAEILADGSLGLDDAVLAQLDVVVASIHSSLRQDARTITERCLKAIHNVHVDILGHPSSRLVGSRDPSALDMPRILQACADTGTAVEINCNPARLDLKDVYARQAADMGCLLALNCDAHSVADLEVLRYGLGVARRAGLSPDNVLNARPLTEVLDFLQPT